MGGVNGRQYVIDEQLKPMDASDIPDGDWETAKKEIARLRGLINKVDCEVLDELEEIEEKHKSNVTTDIAIPGVDSVMVDEDDDNAIIVPPVTATITRQESNEVVRMTGLMNEIKKKLFERTKNLQAIFSSFDSDCSGYISRTEFRDAMREHGMELSDEEFDLVNKTYPHKETAGEVDKGIGYLEFVSMLTGKLTYIPGTGEDDCGDDDDLFRMMMREDRDKMPPMPEGGGEITKRQLQRTQEGIVNAKSEATMMWGNYEEAKAKRDREIELQKMFNRRIFESFHNMKDAFTSADEDKSGYVERDELVNVLASTMDIAASDQEVDVLIREFDTNGDGKLDYQEFVRCLQFS